MQLRLYCTVKCLVFARAFLEVNCTETIKYFIILAVISKTKVAVRLELYYILVFQMNVPELNVNCILTVKVFIGLLCQRYGCMPTPSDIVLYKYFPVVDKKSSNVPEHCPRFSYNKRY
jgi:hypothetical protein